MNGGLLPNRWQDYIGIMVESTATKNQRWFNIFVPEFLPMKMGDVSNETGAFEVSLKNILTDKTEKSKIDVSATIYADYFGAILTSHDVPTMYRGMQVLVLNYASTDKWYWLPLERDDNYKTFEHVRVYCADEAKTNKGEGERDDIESRKKGLTDDNTYFVEIDTKYAKHVMVSTAASDGEEWRYFFKIDAEAHTVELWDNCVDGSQPNNTFKLESRPDPATLGKWTIQNAAGNSIIMQGEDTMINIPRNLTINVGKDTVINRGGNYTEHVMQNYTLIVDGAESMTNIGPVNHIMKDNYHEVVGESKFVEVVKTHQETQMNRTTTSTNASWQSVNWSLTTAVGNFSVQACTWICTTISFQVAKMWSLVTNEWMETAKRVAGTVVTLIRGGHH